MRRATEAFSRRDLDAMMKNWAPDAVVDWSNSRGPESGVYRGQDEIREFAERFLATWDEDRIEIVDGPVEIEDGVLIIENVAYLRGREALEAAGLSV